MWADDPDNHARARAVFIEAVEKDHDDRAAFLDERCADDASLRAAVQELLDAHEAMGGFLEGRVALPSSAPADGTLGSARPAGSHLHEDLRQVAGYRVLRKLGEGAMGVVYEAEQSQPRRRVALKVLASGLVDAEHVARFRREAELLGLFQHPGIARVIEAGADEGQAGGPTHYLAMELIEGRTLTEFADHRALDRTERVELLARVADAVAHAHSRGVVHRDLKPSNVLVDGNGQPKILDFGIARLLGATSRTATLRTRAGEILGTLAYMSPEQAAGASDEVDERSDVFGLGVLAFELLSGRLPHELDDLSLPEALSIVREGPSRRLGRVDASLRGDLDAIVTKTLELDPARRYRSAGELAADLRRHVRSEPIIARPPSVSYRLRRFVTRHRLPVLAVVALTLSLTAGLVRERAARKVADRHALEARRAEYRAWLSSAISADRDGDASALAEAIERAPSDHRGWEWHHLASRVDESDLRFTLPPISLDVEVSRGGPVLALLNRERFAHFDACSGEPLDILSFADDPLSDERLLPGGRTALLRRLDEGPVSLLRLSDRHEQVLGPADRFSVAPGRAFLMRDALGRIDVVDETTGQLSWSAPIAGEVVSTGGGEGVVIRRPNSRWLCRPGAEPVQLDFSTYHGVFSPDGRRLYLGTPDGVELRDGVTGAALIWPSEAPGDDAWKLLLSPDGSRLLTGEGLGRSHLIDAHDGEVLADLGVGKGALPAAFSDDGRLLVKPGRHSELLVFDASDGTLMTRLRGHRRRPVALTFHPDGRGLTSIDSSGAARSWRGLGHGDPFVLRGHESYVYSVDVSPDGQRLATAAWDGTARLWDRATGRAIARIAAMSDEGVHGLVAFSPDGERLLTAHDNTAVIVDLRSGNVLGRLRAEPENEVWQRGRCVGAWWHSSGERFAVHYLHVRLATYEIRDDVITPGPSWPTPDYTRLDLSPDWSWVGLASGEGEGEEPEDQPIAWRDLATWTEQAPLASLPGGRRTGFLADGRPWVTGLDGSVHVGDLDGGPPLTLRGPSAQVHAVASSPDGSRLVTACHDGTVRLWDASDGHCLVVLRGHEAYVHDLAFTPDGETLVSVSGDGTARLWETVGRGERLEAIEERLEREKRLGRDVASRFGALGDATAVITDLEEDDELSLQDRHVASPSAPNRDATSRPRRFSRSRRSSIAS
ncbi:MAG: serine/threonine-protein kinase, partial [Acidobacteriota bacterium]